MADLIPRSQATNGSNGNRASALLFRILAIIHAPTLAVVGWLAVMAINQNKEIALLQQEQVRQAGQASELLVLLKEAGRDRYYRTEALRDMGRLEKIYKEHRNKPWHMNSGEKIIKMEGNIRRLKEDIKELEEVHAGSNSNSALRGALNWDKEKIQ